MASKKKSVRAKSASLSNISTAELHREMAVRQRKVDRLNARREKLLGHLDYVQAELASMGALTASGGVRSRPKNDQTLVEAISDLIDGKTLSVTEIAEQVVKRGYKTTAANFRTIVNQALIRETKIFKKVARGQYTLK